MLRLQEYALQALVRRAQGGNLEALQELLILFRSRTHELASTIADDPESVSRIVQRVFRRVYEAAQRGDLCEDFSMWLCWQVLGEIAESYNYAAEDADGRSAELHRAICADLEFAA